MKKLLLVVAALVGLGMVATPKAEALVALNAGIPLPVTASFREFAILKVANLCSPPTSGAASIEKNADAQSRP